MTEYQGNIVIKNPAIPTGPLATGSAPGIWRLNDVAYWIKQGVWPDANLASDPYFPSVSFLLSTTSLGNASNNLLVDNSGWFNVVNRNGSTTQGSFSPYSSNWSNYFDGSGDYLSVADNAALQFGTGNFTVECWVNSTVTTSTLYNTVIGKWGSSFNTTGDWALRTRFSSNQVTFTLRYSSGWYDIQSGVSINDGAWHHIAAVRDSATTIKVYVDGTLRATQTISSSDIVGSSAAVGVAGTAFLGGQESAFTGYVSNARIVKGTAVYTANFTPSTTPLTAISGTSLLTCQSNRFRDASSNNFTVTRNGDTSVQEFSPFAPTYPGVIYNQSNITNWSGYFDGSGDYLTLPSGSGFAFGTGDFTAEAFFYTTSTSIQYIYDARNSGQTNTWAMHVTPSTGNIVWFNGSSDWTTNTTIPTNSWNHIAYVRSGTTGAMYLNGVRLGTQTDSTNYSVSPTTSYIASRYSAAEQLTGYMSNARTVKGSAVYSGASFTVPTTNLTAISGTSLLTLQNAAFTDNSTNNFVITPFGNATVTGNSPFQGTGYYSNAFSSGNYLSLADATQFNLSGGSYTIEMWINPRGDYGNYNTLVAKRVASSGSTAWEVYLRTGTGVLSYYNGSNYESSSTPTPNAWSHIAAVYDGTNMNLYLNGTRVLQSAVSNSNVSASVFVGTYPSYDERFIGDMSNLRITKGAALYSGASFTPPTGPLTTTVSSGTVSLLTCQSSRFIDNSANAAAITVNGSPKVQPQNPFFTSTISSNGGSMYFNGTSDYVSLQNSPSYALGRGDFTLDMWVYPITQGGHGSGNNDCLMDFRPGSASGGFGTLYLYNNGSNVAWFIQTWGNVILGSPIPNGAWTHLCVSRVSDSTRLFINGVQSGSTYTDSTTYAQSDPWIGQFHDGTGAGYFNGYMTSPRIVKGSGVSTTFTPPTAPVNPTANTTLLLNGTNAGIYDATAINNMQTAGNAQVTTAVSKFGSSSVYFDGSGDYLVSRGNTILLGSGNFTVEFWVYFNAVNNGTVKYLYDFRTASATSASFLAQEASNAWTYWNGAGSSVTTGLSGSTFATGQWYHVAITRSSNVLYCFVNGTKVSSDPADSSNYASATMTLGARYSGSDGLNGYIDDVRLTAGVARYTSNFTPPTMAFPTY